MRRALALVALVLVTLVVAVDARAEPLTFAPPDGFVDRGADGVARLQPMLDSLGLSSSRVVQVADERAGGDVRAAMFAAVVEGSADDVVLPSPSDLAYRSRMAAINQGVTLSRLEVARVTVGGVRALRMIAESPGDGFDTHREVYFVPGETQLGVVTYLVSSANAAAYAPRFAAAIAKTRGLHAVPWWRFSFAGFADADARKLAFLLFALPIGYLLFAAKKRRRRSERGRPD